MTDRQLREIIIEELTDILTEGIFDDIKKSASDATSKLKDLFISKSDKGEELKKKSDDIIKSSGDALSYFNDCKNVIEKVYKELIRINALKKQGDKYICTYDENSKYSTKDINEYLTKMYYEIRGLSEPIENADSDIIDIIRSLFIKYNESIRKQIISTNVGNEITSPATFEDVEDMLVDLKNQQAKERKEREEREKEEEEYQKRRAAAKYGIKELKDGLTLDDIKNDFPWLLEFKSGEEAHRDAIIGLKGGTIKWYGGTCYVDEWPEGIFDEGKFHGRIWTGGKWMPMVHNINYKGANSEWGSSSTWADNTSKLYGKDKQYRDPEHEADEYADQMGR